MEQEEFGIPEEIKVHFLSKIKVKNFTALTKLARVAQSGQLTHQPTLINIKVECPYCNSDVNATGRVLARRNLN